MATPGTTVGSRWPGRRAEHRAGRVARRGPGDREHRHHLRRDDPRGPGAEPAPRRQLELRRKLQAKKTKSAKRVLKRQRRKEARRTCDINHVISKRIVAEAKRTGRGIALEELTGIRDRARFRKPQRVTLHSWVFAQLGQFITYKARRSGVPVVVVDPAGTSRMCADCGHVDKANRVSQAWFICRSCGVVAHADRNASRNIAARAAVAWGAGRQSSAPAA